MLQQKCKHLSNSCASLSQTEALLETVPADWQTCACLSKADALLETVPADRQTSLIHAQPATNRGTLKKLFLQTCKHLSSFLRLHAGDRCTVRNCSSRHLPSLIYASLPITDALLATALRKYDHIANAFLSGPIKSCPLQEAC